MKKPCLNCGSCLFLNREKVFDTNCSSKGKLPTNKSCSSHKPDPYLLAGNEEKFDRLSQVAEAIVGMSQTELQTLAALFLQEKHTRKAGFRLNQKVYVRYAGTKDYMSNFLVGRVVYADSTVIRIIGKSGKLFMTYTKAPEDVTSWKHSVYTEAEFKPLRAKMIAEKLLVDPVVAKEKLTQKSSAGLIVDIDDVVTEDKLPKKRMKSGSPREDDLVAIFSRMQRGIVGRRPLKVYDEPKHARRRTHESGEIVFNRTSGK